ncbi:MAG TPA: hypothetical protein VFY72_03640, partial [Beijerinckiaceae bacterium]|nr:hypothetical protein [Beijerinckiaceae bacterium]
MTARSRTIAVVFFLGVATAALVKAQGPTPAQGQQPPAGQNPAPPAAGRGDQGQRGGAPAGGR